MSINKSIYRLIEEVKVTPEFQKLKNTNSVISNNPLLKKDLEEFNQKQKKLHSSKLEQSQREALIKDLNTMFNRLSKIPEIDKYIKSLTDFNNMMSRVFKNLNDFLENELKQ